MLTRRRWPSWEDELSNGLGRDCVAAVAGVLLVVAFVVGRYVVPDLVNPEEQVGGVQLTFYVNYEGRFLAQVVILFGVASALWLVFVGGPRVFLARAEGQDTQLAPVVGAAGAVAAGLVLLQAAIVVALTALQGNEVGVQAEGSAWSARALFYLEGAVGDMVLFPFAVFLAAAAAVLLRTRVLPGWVAGPGPRRLRAVHARREPHALERAGRRGRRRDRRQPPAGHLPAPGR
jgi:hypothetical protein